MIKTVNQSKNQTHFKIIFMLLRKKSILISIFLIQGVLMSTCFAQPSYQSFKFDEDNESTDDLYYFNSDGDKINDKAAAKFYGTVQRDSINNNKIVQRVFYITGEMKYEANYSNYCEGVLEGPSREWYKNGQQKSKMTYKDCKLDGPLETFWENGSPKRVDLYKSNKLIRGSVFNEKGKKKRYFKYIKIPRLGNSKKGYMQYVRSNFRYPEEAVKNRIQGKVEITFSVDRNGNVKNIKVAKNAHKLLDEEAKRIVESMPPWRIGKIDGEAQEFSFKLPITFRLPSS
jgi:TonB family protein